MYLHRKKRNITGTSLEREFFWAQPGKIQKVFFLIKKNKGNNFTFPADFQQIWAPRTFIHQRRHSESGAQALEQEEGPEKGAQLEPWNFQESTSGDFQYNSEKTRYLLFICISPSAVHPPQWYGPPPSGPPSQPQGGREPFYTHSRHTLYTFYIHSIYNRYWLYTSLYTYYILFPLPHNIPPPQGGGGYQDHWGGGRGGGRYWCTYNIYN